jgi:hypothetical protein
MKKVVLLTFTSVLSLNLFAADPTVAPADEKWLGVIEKIVARGHTEISTPVTARAELVEDWARKNGYTVQITKSDSAIRIKLAKDLAKN